MYNIRQSTSPVGYEQFLSKINDSYDYDTIKSAFERTLNHVLFELRIFICNLSSSITKTTSKYSIFFLKFCYFRNI